MKVRQAVLMVGGKGTRLLPLTENRPKPILPVADKPCIWYLIKSMARAGVEEVILACGYKPGMMEELGDGSDLGIKIIYSYEDEPRGTGGAIKILEDRLDDTFLAANGDVFADIDIEEQVKKHFATKASITISLKSVPNPTEFGIARLDETGKILQFKDKPKPEEVFSDLINSGTYVVQKSVLSEIPENTFFDFSKDLVPIIISKGERVQGYRQVGLWMDVGRPHDLLMANLFFADGENYISKDSIVEDSALSDSAVLKGSKVVGCVFDRVLVTYDCEVKDSNITNSIIGFGCVIDGAVIKNAVLRDGTVLGPGEVVEGDRIV